MEPRPGDNKKQGSRSNSEENQQVREPTRTNANADQQTEVLQQNQISTGPTPIQSLNPFDDYPETGAISPILMASPIGNQSNQAKHLSVSEEGSGNPFSLVMTNSGSAQADSVLSYSGSTIPNPLRLSQFQAPSPLSGEILQSASNDEKNLKNMLPKETKIKHRLNVPNLTHQTNIVRRPRARNHPNISKLLITVMNLSIAWTALIIPTFKMTIKKARMNISAP
jgi:hypothetical protein